MPTKYQTKSETILMKQKIK